MGDAKSLWGRWALIFLITAASVYAFMSKRSVEHPYGVALGQDLKGGTTLRFSLDLARARSEGRVDELETDEAVVHQTMRVIEQRIDKWGLAELSLQAIGDDKFEISLPAEIDVSAIERLVTTLGDLQFRIEVDPVNRRDDQAPTLWSGSIEDFNAFKALEVAEWKSAREQARPYAPKNLLYRVVPRKGTEAADVDDFAVLSEPPSKDERFSGAILAKVGPGTDQRTQDPVVRFEVKLEYQRVFGDWTEKNKGQPMAIVLSEELDSSPVIQDRLETDVQVTLGGGGFGQRDFLEERQKQLIAVLQTGSLKVRPRLESKSTVGPSLAGQAVRRGVMSTAVAFGLVLVFMLAFYLMAGLVANLALVLNLVLLMGAMAFLEATLTLPGIAGIVLTLGMAVDANILIYERIREEQARGRSLVQAVSDGYDRAFTTIIDSNVTTFLTALFLYMLGSGAIKGFAVSLALGLLASMFTAIYVTRTVFETQIARGRTAPIKMSGTGKVPSIGWLGMRRVLVPIALLLVGGSLTLYAASSEDTVYDIDFTGGMKMQARFDRPTSTDEVKKALDGARTTVRVARESGADATTAWRDLEAGPFDDASVVTVGTTGDWVEIKAPLRAGSLAPPAGDTAPVTERERLAALKAYVEKSFTDRLMPSWVRQGPAAYKSEGDADARKRFDGRLKARIAIEDPERVVSAERLKDLLTTGLPYTTEEGGRRVRNPAATVSRDVDVVEVAQTGAEVGGSVHTFDLWWKADHLSSREPVEVGSDKLRMDLREYLGGSSFKEGLLRLGATRTGVDRIALAEPFPVDDLIGAGVAHRQRNDAVLALLLSLVAIVIYVAFRFRSAGMGFSAVLCLFHDVAVALGAVCVANHLGLVDARINLGLVAAFLTIVGFSVNDTVVTFDRIRELRGKAPRVTGRMIDDAVNQTLSRTWRTSATALMTVVVLFVFNVGQRSVLEGLSFTLMVGMVAGVYSTVAVAAPLLLFLPWYWAKVRHWRPRAEVFTWALSAPGIWVVLGAGVATMLGLWLSGTQDLGMSAFYGLLCVPLVATFGVWFAWTLAFATAVFVGGFVMLFPWTRIDDPEAAIDAEEAAAAARERAAKRNKPVLAKPAEAPAKSEAKARGEAKGEARS